MVTKKNAIGRPSLYSEEVAGLICERLIEGLSLRRICQDDQLPTKATVFHWLATNKAFQQSYALARQIQAEVLMDGLIEIADQPILSEVGTRTVDNVERSRLQVETRKWTIAKMLPKKYGDRIEVEHSVNESLAERLKAARANAARRLREPNN